EGEKMSKSLGNWFTLRDLLAKGYSPESIRYLLLSVHYRKQLNFTTEGLRQAQASLQRLEDFLLRANEIAGDGDPSTGFVAEVQAARERFVEAMDYDINTSAALAAVFDFVRSVWQRDSRNMLTAGDAQAAIDFIAEIDSVYNILRPRPEMPDAEIAGQIEARQAARRRRDFAEADRIRDRLLSKKIQLEDTREGVRWKRIQ
ncbi:MAG TPA: DALR domain-containing protein, partial [Acidobacteriota bacterium]|nr:DALR domain-containing protein [Acidobacteriota bacterium]